MRPTISLYRKRTSCLPLQSKAKPVPMMKLLYRYVYCVISSSENRAECLSMPLFRQNVDNDIRPAMGTSLGSVLEHCPRLKAFRLSGSLCSTQIVKRVIQGMKPSPGRSSSLRVLGLGPAGVGILWNDIAHILGFTGVGVGLERVVIAESDLRAVSADARCATLEKFDELRRKGVYVVFAEHRQVGDLL